MASIEELKQENQVPVIITDDQGFVVYINDCFTHTYQWSKEIIGKTIIEIIPINFHDSHNLGFSRFAMTEKSHIANHPIQAMVINKGGEAILSEHYIIAELIREKWFFGATLRPLS